MRKTKIVCTIGPATDKPEVLRELMLAGMNVGRINFSHGNYKDQEERIHTFKKVREELNLPIPLLLDTQGPEIRIGKFENGKVNLKEGQEFTLLNEDILGDNTKVSITYKNLYNEINVGSIILINDGTIEVQVKEIRDKDIVCEVLHGGILTNRKSLNIPNVPLNLPGEYIAASFVRKPQDILDIKKILKENNGQHIKVIAKIENREGIDNFDEILNVSDGIMVARGDLGVEIPMEEVPILQKQFIKKTYKQGKPVITATQMLESMITNPRPTRAEVSDVANAIFDGSSAIMLSGETATGMYPIETMNNIAIRIEESINYWKKFKSRNYNIEKFNDEFYMNYSVCVTAMNIEAKAIVAHTKTGDTPRMLSSFGPDCPIFAITQDKITYRQLGLCWSIIPKLYEQENNIDKMLQLGVNDLRNEQYLQNKDKIAIAGGKNILSEFDANELKKNATMGGIIQI